MLVIFQEMKRIHEKEALDGKPEPKMPKSSQSQEISSSSASCSRLPLRDGVYFVSIDGLDKASDNSLTLFELINRVNPIASIHFNYCLDPGFVLR
jgi:hypothetical protein